MKINRISLPVSYVRQVKKIYLTMKLTGLLILAICLQVSASVWSQNTRVTLKENSTTLQELFMTIENQTGYRFFYNNDEVDVSQKITIKGTDQAVGEILTQAFRNLPYTFKEVENRLILVEFAGDQPSAVVSKQNMSVSGTVTDPAGDPLPGVSIVIKGTSTGTITDVNGHYSLSGIPGNAILQFSFVGMQAQEVPVAGKTTINVVLEEEMRGIDEVVVVGFGVQKKVNLTGAIGTADAQTFEERPVTNAVQALQGAIPGLIISNTASGGELNAAKSIRIRGTGTIGSFSKGDPLVLIDGMEGSLSNINPQDIENVSVLKDAAASSIYGSRAPFGVILVTTKSGKKGITTLNYNNSFRFNTPNMMPELMNSWEFVNYFDDAEFNGSNNHLYDAAYMQKVKDYFEGKSDPKVAMDLGSGGKWNGDLAYGNVDWLEEYYRKWSPSQEHNLSASGGTEKFSYYLSTNYLGQEGFLKHGTDDFSRYTVTGKISANLTDCLKADYSSRYSRVDFSRPTAWNKDFYNDLFRRARPVRPIYDPNGYLASDINYIDPMENGGRRKEQNDQLVQQLRLTITPLKDWNIIGEMNYRTDNNWTHEDKNLIYSHYADNPENTYKAVYSPANSNVLEYSGRTTYLNPNVYTNYSTTIGKHNLAGTAGFQFESSKSRTLTGGRNDLITYDLPVLDLTTSTTGYSLGGNYNDWATAGFFGRVNYDYDGRYLVEVNGRYDGSSRFRRDSRWVMSPSASLGWNIARENFFAPYSNLIQMLKFRASYGVLANQNTNELYPTYQTVGTGTAGANWILNGQKPNIASAPSLVSTTLTWEKINTRNVGLDFSMLNSRLSGSFDYFIRETEDMVAPGVELPAILGTLVPPTNNTDLETYGWELELSWRDKKGDFSYGVQLNISDAVTKITKFANSTGLLTAHIPEQKMNDIYGYTTVGIARTDEEMQAHLAPLTAGGQNALGSKWAAGDMMYADINGDKKINSGANTIHDMGDLKKIGNSTPRFLTGVNLNAEWKGLSLQMFWQGVLKRDYVPGDMVFWGANAGGQWWSTALKPHLDYFRADEDHPLGQNLDSYYARPLFNGKNQQVQTRYLQSAAYLRLKSLQIGYTLPAIWTKGLALQKVRFFAAGENLLTLTSLSEVMDPETAGVGVRGGIVYPLSRTYSFGVSVNF